MKRGFLLMNTGSPDSTQPADLHRYLKEFLMDPCVIDLPWPLRAMLVDWIILPQRSTESSKAYKKIWTEHGSPLLHYCERIKNELRQRIDDPIEIGMAYGNPSFKSLIGKLLDLGIDELCLLPMFPQYAMATFKSCVDGVVKELKRHKSWIGLRIVPPFYNEPTYIQPLAESLAGIDEHILFSYHGLPLRHLKKVDPTKHHCLSSAECCSEPSIAHDTCYRFQCYSTTRTIVNTADIPFEHYSISFQSRMGRTKWMEPYTEEMLRQLPGMGHKRLAVICPAFFCDCLETLEEIAIRGKETFIKAGGKSFRMIPCLNSSEAGIHCLETLMRNADNWPLQELV